MKSSSIRCAVLAALLLAPVAHGASPEASPHHAAPPLYHVIDLPSLGGTVSEGRTVNDLGMVSGLSLLPGNAQSHAVLWLGKLKLDLGTFGGPNSAVAFGGTNDRGLIVGIAERDDLDPLQEAWSCSAFFPGGLGNPTGHVCRGFAWFLGQRKELPTLGGTHSFAASANNDGLVVGWAENDVEDPDCVPPQVLQFRGVVWNPRTGELTELPPFPGDKVSTGNAINDRGQIVGISGICDQAVGRASAIHAVLWEDGDITDLGNLGEEVWNTPLAINEAGEVVGFAGLASGFLGAFHWTEEGGIQPLGTLNEDHVHGEAWDINERGQAVGVSCDASFADCRAFLWHDDAMTDLNDLVVPGYANHLRTARGINDFGMITGQSVDPDTGERRAYLAIPIPGDRRGGGD